MSRRIAHSTLMFHADRHVRSGFWGGHSGHIPKAHFEHVNDGSQSGTSASSILGGGNIAGMALSMGNMGAGTDPGRNM